MNGLYLSISSIPVSWDKTDIFYKIIQSENLTKKAFTFISTLFEVNRELKNRVYGKREIRVYIFSKKRVHE